MVQNEVLQLLGKDIPVTASYCRHCGKELRALDYSDTNNLEERNQPPYNQESESPVNTPRPWLRFWARYIDISFFFSYQWCSLIVYPNKAGSFFGFFFSRVSRNCPINNFI